MTYKAKGKEHPIQVEKANKFNKNTIPYEQIENRASQTDKGWATMLYWLKSSYWIMD